MSAVTVSFAKSHFFVRALSLNQPPKVLPVFVGSAGALIEEPYSYCAESILLPPFVLNVTVYLLIVQFAVNARSPVVPFCTLTLCAGLVLLLVVQPVNV